MKLLSFEGYSMLNESSKAFEADLDKTLNESIGAALGSPIKFMKIKKNAKQYQQALVQVAINNLDFEKKKVAGNMDSDKEKVLKAANAQKNQALKDKASAISDRMDQLATTAGLKKVASIAKNKSKMAAAETALKTADGEEAKALKLKIKGLNAKVAADQQELSDYEKADGPKTQNLDDVKTNDGEGGKGKTSTNNGEGGKGKTTTNNDEGGKGKTTTNNGEGGKGGKKKFGETSKADKVKAFDDQIKRLKDKITSAESKLNDDSIPANAKDGIKKNIDDMKAKVSDFEKKKSDLGESYDTIMLEMKALEEQIDSLIEGMLVYRVDESISDKFRRLMANV